MTRVSAVRVFFFLVRLNDWETHLDALLVPLVMLFEIGQLQPFRPSLLVQVHQHALFRL